MVICRACTGLHAWVLLFILPLELRAGPGPRSEHRTPSQLSHCLLPAPDCHWHRHETQLREVKPGSAPQAAHSSHIAFQEPVCSLPCLSRSVGSAGSCGHIPAQLQRPSPSPGPWLLCPVPLPAWDRSSGLAGAPVGTGSTRARGQDPSLSASPSCVALGRQCASPGLPIANVHVLPPRSPVSRSGGWGLTGTQRLNPVPPKREADRRLVILPATGTRAGLC